jgi:succinate dehydrogenase/fumarate reductase flavoprotein subunit
MKGGAWLNDPELVRILVTEAPERMDDLIRWGAVFDFTDDDRIAHIDKRGEHRLIFARQQLGNARGQSAEDLAVRVDHMPLPVDFLFLPVKSSSSFTPVHKRRKQTFRLRGPNHSVEL